MDLTDGVNRGGGGGWCIWVFVKTTNCLQLVRSVRVRTCIHTHMVTVHCAVVRTDLGCVCVVISVQMLVTFILIYVFLLHFYLYGCQRLHLCIYIYIQYITFLHACMHVFMQNMHIYTYSIFLHTFSSLKNVQRGLCVCFCMCVRTCAPLQTSASVCVTP